MSKEVDERVVSMQFNNKDFEANAQTTLGTLDKLKQKLNLSGATKGMENLTTSVKRVDMSGLDSAVQTVTTRFSALQVMGVTALSNLTNSAVNAGKRIASALTIDPIKTGMSEYELKLDSVQTIMASTGDTIETVNKYLEELNAYSDQTIYSFSDMTSNIGKFTNAGVKLEDAVTAIKGISNAAALSGANANEASRSMYNFAQALSAGYVKLIDWKSIELANMATKSFKDELIKTGVEVGTLTKKGDKYVSTTKDMNGKVSEAFTSTSLFNESLSSQWMTTDVLTKTLAKYTDETTDLGQRATEAATQTKSLSQMFDVLKETAQSGWAQTWEIIFGDLNQAKSIFTPLTTFFGNIIDSMSKFRNKLLKGALGNPFEGLLDKIDSSPLGKFTKSVSDASKKLEYYQDIVSKVWNGDYQNAPVRYQLLDDAGYDHKIVQSLVNKGYDYKLTVEDIEEAYKKYGKTLEKTEGSTKDFAKAVLALSDEELKNMGYTQGEIDMLRALAKEAERTGKPLSELIEELGKMDGRTLLINSFKNAGQGLAAVFKAMKNAWVEIFEPKSTEEKSIQLYNIIKAINNFSEKIKGLENRSEDLTKTFKGLFALIDIILIVVGGPLRLAFKLLKEIMSYLGVDILDVTANVGDAIVAFRDWIDSLFNIEKAAEAIVNFAKKAKKAIADWIEGLKSTDDVPGYIISSLYNGIIKGFTKIKDAIVKLVKNIASWMETNLNITFSASKAPWYIISGFCEGLTGGFSKVKDIIVKLAKNIISWMCDVLGIESPAKEFIEIAKYCILGLAKGFKIGIQTVNNVVEALGSKLVEIIKNLNIKEVFTAIAAGGAILAGLKLADAIGSLVSPLESLGDMFEGIGSAMKGLGHKFKAEALLDLAKAIAIVVAAVVVLTFVDVDKAFTAVIFIGVLAGILLGFSVAVDKLSKSSATLDKNGLKISGLTSSIAAIGVAVLMMTFAAKMMSKLNAPELIKGIGGLIGVFTILGLFVIAVSKVQSDKAMKYVGRIGTLMTRMAIAMLLMLAVVKIANKLDSDELENGIIFIGSIGLMFALMGLIAANSKTEKAASKMGAMLIKVSVAMLLMVGVMKLAAKLEKKELLKGIAFISAVGVLFAMLTLVSHLAGENAAKAGSMLLQMSVAMLLMVGVMKLAGSMEPKQWEQGLYSVAVFGLLAIALVAVARKANKNVAKVGLLLMSMSVALIVLAGLVLLLSLLEPEPLKRAVIAIGVLGLVFIGLIAVTKLAKTGKGIKTILIELMVAVALLAGVVIALSFIDKNDLIYATGALAAIIGVFMLLMICTRTVKSTKNVRKTILEMVGVVAVLGALVVGLSFIDAKNALIAIGALTILLADLIIFIAIARKFKSIPKTIKKTIIFVTGVITALAALVALMSFIDALAALKTVGVLTILMTELVVFMFVLNKIPALNKASRKNLILMVGVMTTLILLIGLMSFIDAFAALKTIGVLTILLAELLAFSYILNKIPALNKKSQENLILMVGVISTLTLLLAVLSLLDAGSSLKSVGVLAVLMLSIVAFMVVLNKVAQSTSGLGSTITTLISLAGVLILLTAAIALMGTMSWDQITKGLAALAVGMVILVGAMHLMPSDMVQTAASMMVLAASMVMLSFALNSMGSMSWEEIAKSLVALAGSLLILVVAMNFMQSGLAGAAAMIIMALALNMLVPVLTTLGSMSLSEIGVALLALAGVFLILGVAGYALSPVVVVILGLATAIMLIGAGAFLAGAGVLLFALALQTLSSIGPEGILALVTAITAVMTAIIMLIPLLVQKIGEGIVLFCEAIANGAGAICSAVTAVVLAILEALGTCIPAIIETGIKLLLALLNGIADNIYKITELSLIILAKFINAIADNIGGVVDAGVNLIVKFSKAIGDNAYRVIQAGIDLMLDLIDALASGIRNNIDRVIDATNNLIEAIFEAIGACVGNLPGLAMTIVNGFVKGLKKGFGKTKAAGKELIDGVIKPIKDKVSDFVQAAKDCIDGFIKGIKDKVTSAVQAVKDFGGSIVDKFKDVFDINSPSKVLQKLGSFCGLGYNKGLKETFGNSLGIVGRIGNKLINEFGKYNDVGNDFGSAMRNAISTIYDLLDNNIDSQPTIRPVLDLSDVESGSSFIDSLFGGQRILSVNGYAVNNASALMAKRQNGVNDDIVSAIKGLRKDISTMPRNNYNLNGLTYEEGSDVAEALQTIVRAARIERRV